MFEMGRTEIPGRIPCFTISPFQTVSGMYTSVPSLREAGNLVVVFKSMCSKKEKEFEHPMGYCTLNEENELMSMRGMTLSVLHSQTSDLSTIKKARNCSLLLVSSM